MEKIEERLKILEVKVAFIISKIHVIIGAAIVIYYIGIDNLMKLIKEV